MVGRQSARTGAKNGGERNCPPDRRTSLNVLRSGQERAFLLINRFSCSEFDAVRDRDRRISSNCAQNHCPHLTSVAHPLKRLVMTSELPKTFEPSAIEARWYPHWESKGLFRPERPDAQPFTIVNPPPNVTGSLHIGHALDNTLQDIVIRYERLRGKDALWVVGTDHAGIATQMVVERQMNAKGQKIGRAHV